MNNDAEYAFRRRIQSQALIHLVDQKVDASVVFRFRQAGTWDASIQLSAPLETERIIREPDYPRRLTLPPGPLVVIEDDQGHGIIDVADHLLSLDASLRDASVEYFIQPSLRSYISPFCLNELAEHRAALLSTDEQVWIPAALRLSDCLKWDYRLNVAGTKQSALIRFDEGYSNYLQKALRPPRRSFEHELPPVWDPGRQVDQFATWFSEWGASGASFTALLDRYLEVCGYLPLTERHSLAAAIDVWISRNGDTDVWSQVWHWVDRSLTPIAGVHAGMLFLSRPQWIPKGAESRLSDQIRKTITTHDKLPDDLAGQQMFIRTNLQRHFQYHCESLAPNLESGIVGAYACWCAEQTAGIFSDNSRAIRHFADTILAPEVQTSRQRWTVARSRVSPSPLRSVLLFSSSVWADSLVIHATRAIGSPGFGTLLPGVADAIVERLTNAMCAGRVHAAHEYNVSYAFEEPIQIEHLRSDALGSTGEREAAEQFLRAIELAQSGDGIKTLLADLPQVEDHLAYFCGVALRARQFSRGCTDPAIKAAISDPKWRQSVFHRLPLRALDPTLNFLVEWLLHQEIDVYAAMLELLAAECENAVTAERRQVLFLVTLWSSLAGDCVAAVTRLLRSERAEHFRPVAMACREMLDDAVEYADPWLASRARGFRGSLGILFRPSASRDSLVEANDGMKT